MFVRLPPSLPRLPLVPDPLRRVRVSRDLDSITTIGHEEDPADGGMTEKGVEKVWDAVVDLYRSGVHPAAQFCYAARERSCSTARSVTRAATGRTTTRTSRRSRPRPTPRFCVFSTSKGITAMVVHLLHERGALDIADRVADHIPEYAAHGKGSITIAHVLAHRAGVASLPRKGLDLDRIADRDFLVEMLCEAKAVLPGKLLAYHAVSGGFILGEIVHRVTGKDIRAVLAEQILDPLGFRWGNYGVAPEDVDQVGLNYVTGPPLLPPLSMLVARVLSAPIDQVVELSNDPRFLDRVIPSANLVTTANELSRFFELLRAGGELDGVPRFYGVMQRVASQAPKGPPTGLLV